MNCSKPLLDNLSPDDKEGILRDGLSDTPKGYRCVRGVGAGVDVGVCGCMWVGWCAGVRECVVWVCGCVRGVFGWVGVWMGVYMCVYVLTP